MVRLIFLFFIVLLCLALLSPLLHLVKENWPTDQGDGNRKGGKPQCAVAGRAEVPSHGETGEAVSFATMAAPQGCATNVTYQWSFGDGASASTQKPKHAYKVAGTYIWQVTGSALGATPYTQSGSIEIQQIPTRLIVVLFLGLGTRTEENSGMKTLLQTIKSSFDDHIDIVGNVFTCDDTANKESWHVWRSYEDFQLNLPHQTAVNWVLSQKPHTQDKIVLVGHSYGGNRARVFAGDLLLKGVRAAALITVDPIDWETCNVWSYAQELGRQGENGLRDLLGLDKVELSNVHCDACRQTSTLMPILGKIPEQRNYVQKNDCLNGYKILPHTETVLNVTHTSIDDEPEIHRKIIEVIRSSVLGGEIGAPKIH